MVERPLWLNRIQQTWKQASIVWLSGVRRVGKTTLAQHLADAKFAVRKETRDCFTIAGCQTSHDK
jgi:predicted AAA+ superfamily ATPase